MASEETQLSLDSASCQKITMCAIGGMMLLVLAIFIGNVATSPGGFDIVLLLLMAAIALGLQGYYFKRVLSEWDGMTNGKRWWTAFAGVMVPPTVAFVAPIVAALALFLWIVSIFFGEGTSGRSSRRSTSSGPNFGSWWGEDRVISGAHGQPIWVGDDEVKYGADGKPAWVGEREVKYGSDGNPVWVGDDEMTYGGNGTPKWVGDREILP